MMKTETKMKTIVVLAMDGLEYNYVERFGCKNLKQVRYGKTDISAFKEPRTVVIWSSFLAGRNLEKKVLSSKELWKFKVKKEASLLSDFVSARVIDLPGYNYSSMHQEEKKLLKGYFEKENSIADYDKVAFKNHETVKNEFFEALRKKYDLLIGYFALADVIGHLSFGDVLKMRLVYGELDGIAAEVRGLCEKVLIISDHGMEAVGRFGDHSKYGFWSLSNLDMNVLSKMREVPEITDFRSLLKSWG